MADLTDLQAAQTVKVVGANSSGVETNPVNADSNGNLQTINPSDGPVIPGTVANNANLAGGQYNSTPPTLTNTQQVALQVNSRGRLNTTAQYKFVSTVNSSTANLATSATFTGTGESSDSFNAIQINFIADKNCIIQCQQSIDNTNWDIVDAYNSTANIGDGRTFQVTSSFYRILVTNNDLSSTTFLRLQTILTSIAEVLPRAISNSGKLSITHVAPNGTPGFVHGKVTASAIAVVRNTAYIEQTSNAQRSIASSSASDAAVGVGARTIRITYLDVNNNGFFTETLTLNGTTPVNTVNTNICYIEKIEVLSAGSFGSNVGVISLKAATAGGGVTVFSIAASDSVTFQAHHYVPAGKIGYIQSLSVSSSSGDSALFHIIFSNHTTDFNMGRTDEVQCPVSGSFLRRYENPLPIPSGFHMTVVVTPDSTGTFYASVEYFDV